jgi:hypothetical protein
MKPLEKVVLIVFALLVIYSSVDLLNYNSWPKFYMGVTLIAFSLIILFIVFKSFFNRKN